MLQAATSTVRMLERVQLVFVVLIRRKKGICVKPNSSRYYLHSMPRLEILPPAAAAAIRHLQHKHAPHVVAADTIKIWVHGRRYDICKAGSAKYICLCM
jgi:hypothetical protein